MFKQLSIENLLRDLVYLVAGAIANVWFQSLTNFWSYQSSFIDIYSNDKIIYLVLFFGVSFVVGLLIREIGDSLTNLVIGFLAPDSNQSPVFTWVHNNHKITKYYDKVASIACYILISRNLADFKALSPEDYFYSRSTIKDEYVYLFERAKTRELGHRIIVGFLFLNLCVFVMYLGKINTSSLIISILFLVSISNFLKVILENQVMVHGMRKVNTPASNIH